MLDIKKWWWKWLCLALLAYTVIGGLLMDVPRLVILNETIRNLYFHVTMWFTMVLLLSASVVYSVMYLRRQDESCDIKAVEFANAGIAFGMLGILTGMIWARFTWGDFWSGDPKQNASAVTLLIYLAYLVLRNALNDDQQRARISAVYNIFAFCAMIPLLFILPRLTDSLHPGSGGNPGFSYYDLDSKLRMVFYPAIMGWTLLGVWMASLSIRLRTLSLNMINRE